MLRKVVIAIVFTAAIAFEPTDASARGGFRGGGFHGGGFRGGGFHAAGVHRGFAGGWRGGGWRGGGVGWRTAGWRGGGWGWGAPAVAAGVGLGLASTAAWNSGWGWDQGWGWGNPGGSYAAWGGGCTQWRRVWTGWGWQVAPVNVC